MAGYDYLNPKDGPVVPGLESDEIVYAKDQPEYRPLRTLRSVTPEHKVISRWTFTPEQRQAIASGADIYLELFTGGDPLQPIRMAVSDVELDPNWVRVCLLGRTAVPSDEKKRIPGPPDPRAHQTTIQSDEETRRQ